MIRTCRARGKIKCPTLLAAGEYDPLFGLSNLGGLDCYCVVVMLLAYGLRGIGYFAVGEFTREAWLMFAAAFPLMLAGIYIGDRVQVRIDEQTFRRLVCITRFLCGIPLLLK